MIKNQRFKVGSMDSQLGVGSMWITLIMMEQMHHHIRSDGFENSDTPTVQARMPS